MASSSDLPVAFCDAAMSLVVIDGGLVAEAQLDARGLLPLRAKAPDVGELSDEITAVFDKERERPARLHRAELCSISYKQDLRTGLSRGTHELVEGEGPSQARFIDDDELSRLEAPFGDGLVHRRDPGAELGRGGRVGYALRARFKAKRSRRDFSSGMRRHSVSHLAVFSVSIPSSSASTCAATAEGARPITDPGPCSSSQAALRPAMVVDFPLPAGPTSTSRTRPEVAIFSTARAWSTLSP